MNKNIEREFDELAQKNVSCIHTFLKSPCLMIKNNSFINLFKSCWLRKTSLFYMFKTPNCDVLGIKFFLLLVLLRKAP